jgi:hypothetical protein
MKLSHDELAKRKQIRPCLKEAVQHQITKIKPSAFLLQVMQSFELSSFRT